MSRACWDGNVGRGFPSDLVLGIFKSRPEMRCLEGTGGSDEEVYRSGSQPNKHLVLTHCSAIVVKPTFDQHFMK